MNSFPDRFLHDAMRAGLVLGWLSVTAVVAALVLGVHVDRREVVIGLTAAAAAAHTVIAFMPWRRWLSDRRGQALLDLWALGLLGYVALLVIAGGGRTGFDLLLFLIVPFLALVHAGRRRWLFLAGATLAYIGPMALTRHPLPLGGVALHGLLLCAVALLALVLDRAVRREAAARAQAGARAELERALLAESHHRVKNSLQTVSDLLLLSRSGNGNGDGGSLDRTAERIRAIAVVHRLLGDRLGRAVSADELLHAVAAAAAPDTALEIVANDVLLEPAQAQQLGVIANELIANAARHGRPPISVCLAIGEPASLVVRNGGSPPACGTEGLGLRLVRQVTEHGLHGSFRLDREADGTHADVRFRLASHARAHR